MSPAAGAADVLILGAGGAGLMCAREAALRGRKTVVLDHAEKIGRKILVSGGGRCNFTNLLVRPDRYVSANPNFAASALARFTPEDFIALVEARSIAYHEKKLGQLFCDESAQKILDLLLTEAAEAGATVVPAAKITAVDRVKDGFRVRTPTAEYRSGKLVIATGGRSISKTGATGYGYDLARMFGHAVIEPEPALVGLKWSDEDFKKWMDLAGVAVPDTIVSLGTTSFREAILFTHTGLSGPAILQISLYWHPGDEVKINLMPDVDVIGWLKGTRAAAGSRTLAGLLIDKFPQRLAAWFATHMLPPEPLARLSDGQLASVAQMLTAWPIQFAATEGWEKAEVSRGGVDTDGLSSKTMESKKVPGLHFIGEVVDVTGWLGGYNFQWAWSSGAAAGRAV